jgi:hypothetical protein
VAPAAERVLTEGELNRALLARQLLLERAKLPIPRALERVGGIQAQYAPSSYIGLFSRLDGIALGDLTRALERRTVVQGTLQRVTIHLVPAKDYRPIVAGIAKSRREWWLRAVRHGVKESEMRSTAKRARKLLRIGPMRRRDLVKALDVDTNRWNGLGLWIDLVRVPPSGTWEQRRADLYALADDWLGSEASPKATERQGLELLVRRYLTAFSPATVSDIATWAGVPPKKLTAVTGAMNLRRFRDEKGAELVDLARGPLPDAGVPAPVRLLPTWDASLLVHARRTGIVPESHRPKIFNTKTPQSVPVFLVDGRVAGTWKDVKGRVTFDPFDRLPKSVVHDLKQEAERYEGFVSGE